MGDIILTTKMKYHCMIMITKAYLLHVVDGLVEDVERPVRRGERGEDGAPQLQAARPDLQCALKHLHSVVVLALKFLTYL